MPDLKISEPDLRVKEREREDVVDERFGSPGLGRHAKYLLLLFFTTHGSDNEYTIETEDTDGTAHHSHA